jgi:hypothetical protein
MPQLFLSTDEFGGRGIVLGLTESPSPQERRSWISLVAGVLTFRFLGHPACLITLPGTRGRSFVADRGDLVAVRRGARLVGLVGGFWVGLVGGCSESLLHAVAAEEEFELGELWLTAIPQDELTRVDQLIRSKPLPGWRIPDTSEELMALTDDGRQLIWLNPSLGHSEVTNHIRQASDDTGWSLAVRTA